MIGAAARRLLPESVRRVLKRCLGGMMSERPASHGHEILTTEPPPELSRGWQDPRVAKKQQEAFQPLLKAMHEGLPREDFVALAQAVRRTGMENPSIIEVGCGSGWNYEVLTFLNAMRFRYLGLDYSPAMIALAKQRYPTMPFIVGDATRLPFQDNACDILLSGTVLMHLLGYREAIQESQRVARRWCLFHTVPLTPTRPTTTLRKFAYGSPVLEVVLNEAEIVNLIESNGLVLQETFESVPHDYLSDLLGEPVRARTLLCGKR